MDEIDLLRDKHNFVYIVLLNIGIGSVLPWNAFSTSNSYFVDFKLADTNATTTDIRPYRESYLSFMGFFAMLPNLILQISNLLYKSNKDSGMRRRITTAMIIQAFVLIVTIVLAVIDTSSWPVVFFYITMVCVVILNMAAGIYQNLSWATAAKLPMKYSNSVMIGCNASGTVFSIAMIISTAVSTNIKLAALIFFVFSLAYHMGNMILYQFLFKSEYFVKFRNLPDAADTGETELSIDEGTLAHGTAKKNIRKAFELGKQCWTQLLNVFLLNYCQLCTYPALQASVESLDHVLSDHFFAPVTTFLTFNVAALVGNLLTTSGLPIPGPDRLWIPVCLRFLLIPAMLFCNYRPQTRVVPVLFKSDIVYALLSALQGLSVGYLLSLSVMYAPKMVSKKDSPTVGMMVGISGMIAQLLAVTTTFLWPVLIG